MKPSEAVMNKFYQNIGKLFYAVAAIDQDVQVNEIEILRNIIRKDWLSMDDATDTFGTDAAFQIEIVFDYLLDKQTTATECLNRFKTYYKEHKHLFTAPYNKQILKTAEEIAGSFYGMNKMENQILSEIHTLFK